MAKERIFAPTKTTRIANLADSGGSSYLAVNIHEWADKPPTIDFRRFYTKADGTDTATSKGFSLQITDLPDMAEAVARAIKRCDKIVAATPAPAPAAALAAIPAKRSRR